MTREWMLAGVLTGVMTGVLGLVGVVIMALGLNIGLGGIRTLGWQSATDFISVTDVAVFQVSDSHIRFVGGIWFGVGGLFFLGAYFRAQLGRILAVLCGVIAVAGLFRLSGEAALSAAVLPSLMLELVGFPLLGCWLVRSTRQSG